MTPRILAGPNFSGRTLRMRRWVGLPDDITVEPVYAQTAYIGPDASSAFSGIAHSVGAEIDLVAADQASAAAAKTAMESFGFGHCLTQNPFTLSGGEQVVAAIASAISGRPLRIAIDCSLEQLSPPIRTNVLNHLYNLDTELMLADNRLDEWFSGKTEQCHPQANTPAMGVYFPLAQQNISYTVEIVDLCHAYEKGRQVFKNLNLTLESGRNYVLKGPNGCGKSTLSKILCGLIKPLSGEIRVNGCAVQPWRTPGRFVGYHFQNPDYQLFSLSVRKQLGPHFQENLAKTFGFGDLLNSHPLDLPYVLKKRIAIAATFAREKGLLIFDEPSLGQDNAFVSRFIRMLHGVTTITISHSQQFTKLEQLVLGES